MGSSGVFSTVMELQVRHLCQINLNQFFIENALSYASNLPLIGKTRTNFKQDSASLDELCNKSVQYYHRHKNSLSMVYV